MMISERKAAAILGRFGMSRSAAQHVLATGAAGRPIQRSPLLYDLATVDECARRPLVDDSRVARVCPAGYLVARLPRTRMFDVAASWEDRSTVLAGPWRVDPKVHLVLSVRVATGYRLPLVLLVSGFVLAGADLVGMGRPTLAATPLVVEPPGEWFDLFRGRRCAAGRGRQTELRGWPLQQ